MRPVSSRRWSKRAGNGAGVAFLTSQSSLLTLSHPCFVFFSSAFLFFCPSASAGVATYSKKGFPCGECCGKGVQRSRRPGGFQLVCAQRTW